MSSASAPLSPAPAAAADAPQAGAAAAADAGAAVADTPTVEMSDAPAAEAETGSDEAAGAGEEKAAGSSKKGAKELRTPAFALARVGKIIKADADIDTLPKESLRAIALAAELIIGQVAAQSVVHARLERPPRQYLQYCDISWAVRKNEMEFLHDIIPAALPLPVAIRRRAKYIQELKDAQSGEGNAAELLEQIKQIPIWHGDEAEGEHVAWDAYDGQDE